MEEKVKENVSKRKGWLQAMPDVIQRNALLLVEILLCIILYICNRYAYQRDQVLTERLKRELTDIQYQTLNTTSDVSAKSKPSYIESVAARNGSGLQPSIEPPFRLPK